MATPVKATTQEHLNLEDVVNDVVYLKDGRASVVISVSAVNFGLLSEQEQDAIIYAYASLLNSLTFPIQVLIRSQKKDISGYVKHLHDHEIKQQDPIYRQRISQYRQFIETVVKERNVLDKKFYVIIPFTRADLGVTTSVPFKSAKPNLEMNYIIQKATSILFPRRDHMLRQFARIGLAARQLKSQELIQLLYTIYNRESSDGVELVTASEYASPIVIQRS